MYIQYLGQKSCLARGIRLQKTSCRFMRRQYGEMAEWLKAHAWKACVRETVPWVRIPLSPPLYCSFLYRLFESTAKQRLARRMPLRLVPRCDPWSCELQHRPSKYGSHLVSSAARPAAP